MSNKYKKSLTFIGILIVLCGMLEISYIKYQNNKPEFLTLVEANGELSVNYINGNIIDKDGVYEFSVTNNSNKDFYYEIAIKDLRGFDESLKYSITSSEALVNKNNISLEKDNDLLVDNVLIKASSTENFKLSITNNKKTSFALSIHKMSDEEEYFFATILKNNEVKKEPTTKPSIDISNTNEGLIESVDDNGVTYYFRGIANNNYVSFAGALWRIVRINGDGTVRLVLNNAISELGSFADSKDTSEDYQNSAIITKLTNYYEYNLKTYDSYIASSKYCKESEFITTSNNKNYNAYTRINVNNIPSFSCLGEVYRSKIGLLTVDEVAYAGANMKDDNENFYLYNKDIENIWWTSNLAKTTDDNFYPFSITSSGKISDSNNGTLYRNIRPVINIIKKATVKGNGTIDLPYTINQM